MSVCDENCRDCVFRAWMRFRLICNFLGVMGRRRGCPAGVGCAEKIVGEARQSLETRLYRLPPNPEKKAAPAGGTGDPSSAPSGHLTARPPQAAGPLARTDPPGEGKDAEEEKAKAEEAARIAEKKRKKAEQHRAWVARNREHLREYQQEYRRKAKEAAERGTGVPSSVPSGQLPPGEANETA